ncbi:MAG: serine hydrolase domain-containing protein, partial [Armatimonadota bacterium]|nr:serine hydrolase domain-containing protein [Armatimonadota bacterium]
MNLVRNDASSAGMDPGRLQQAANLLEEGAQKGLYPGGVVWVERRGATVLVHSAGYVDFEQTAPVDQNTIYDLASVTKPVAMASSMLILCQQGRVHFGQLVTDFFPDRRLPHLKNVTLRHLLTHTSGLPPWKDMYSKGQSRQELIDELLAIPLDHEPGTHYAYSCLGYILLSVILEKITGIQLDEFASTHVFEPLEMHSTGFNPKAWSKFPIAATDNCPMRKCKLVGEVHDGNAYAMGGVSGNAGLFSSAADLAKFCRALVFAQSEAAGRSSPFALPSLRKVFENAIPESIGGQTIGWFTFPNDMMPGGDLVSRRAIGHSGFTGTAVV